MKRKTSEVMSVKFWDALSKIMSQEEMEVKDKMKLINLRSNLDDLLANLQILFRESKTEEKKIEVLSMENVIAWDGPVKADLSKLSANDILQLKDVVDTEGESND